MLLTVSALSALLGGCIDSAVEATQIDLRSVGNDDARAPFEGRDGAIITLDRADLAFGPLYLCAGHTAGELCEEALAEWRDARVIDTLESEPLSLGNMVALTGTSRSYMYDLGIVSRLTDPENPLVTEAAHELGDASAVLEGVVDVSGQRVPFRVAVRIEQSPDVSQGVPVVRSGASDRLEGRIAPDGATRLTVHFDPRDWLATAPFAELVENRDCAADATVVCGGAIERRCAEDGTLLEERDCSASGEVCLRGLGCAAAVDLDPAQSIGRAVESRITVGERPEFEFEITVR